MKCLRIKFILPNHYPLTFESQQVISLEMPEETLQLAVNEIKETDYISYTFKSNPIKTEIDNSSIAKLENALFSSFMKYDIGLLVNKNLASGVITEHSKKLLGENIDSDFVGIKVVDCGKRHLVASAQVVGNIPGNSLLKAVNSYINATKPLDDKFKRSIELYNSTNYLSRVNNSGRFVLLMSAIECLIDPKENQPEILDIIRNAKTEVQKLNISDDVKNSVAGSLDFLKKESIKRSGRTLIDDLFQGISILFNNLNPSDFFSKAYDLRSKLVHEGKSETKHLSIEAAQMHDFVSSCLKKYYEKNYNML